MSKFPTLSGVHLQLEQIDEHYKDTVSALRNYYLQASSLYKDRFIGFTPDELADVLRVRLREVELAASLSAISSVEAAFRIDYLQRAQQRRKDPLSRDFRFIYRNKGSRTNLEEDILNSWRKHASVDSSLFSALKDMIKFRHWLAHGRYWNPKLGRKWDYPEVYYVAKATMTSFPLMTQMHTFNNFAWPLTKRLMD